jgi:putative transposase
MDTNMPPTIWDIPADVWTLIEPLLGECYPAKPKGHRRLNLRPVLNGILFRWRTGGPWHQRPQPFGDDSTVPRHFQRWCPRGLLARLWSVLVETGEDLGGVDWPWPAADTAMGKARRGGDVGGRHPTDRGQKGCSGAAWWKRRVAPWAPPSLGRMSTAPRSWPPPWRRSS